MSRTWHSEDLPATPALDGAGRVRAALRGTALALLLVTGLALHLVLRLVERPLFGLRRPVTPYVTQGVCRGALAILGLRFRREGRPMRERGAVVANHSSWLDIFVLNAGDRIYFVSKSEVRDWPGIGWLARATGTVFIRRDPREARAQQELFAERLKLGHRLLFFPEGTSTDGMRVLPFIPTLFQAFLTDDLKPILHVQPVSVRYSAPDGEEARFYGWWGDMGFGPHLVKVLAARRQGTVEIVYHPPLKADAFADRKALAARAAEIVRAGLGRG
ncbi:lysophospholipid acyltransferase family protein [Tranquillimonas alkanivorans]|uniref:Lyso-ornithine lipid acyltransferase n=1 Tax=Tranquillimonas alkanivorans TaxID=441119 RepID=A0A1I5RV79_9RHOB|nr:lysophospholipid acyltransferase family protein [Tranquillimonas alkanivorans]SFP62330.1 lyso-ornithine lipid acyltransferase [Tranquillimonas alkanivorans]